MTQKPYIALDLETTGLPEENPQILQISAVLETFDREVDKLRSFNFFIDNGSQLRGNHFALAMNAGILHKICEDRKRHPTKGSTIADLRTAQTLFSMFIQRCLKKTKLDKIQIAGKNIGSFDIPILQQNGFNLHGTSHRFIDVGALYYMEFGEVPSFSELLKKYPSKRKLHDALEDAKLVVEFIRRKTEGKS